MVRHATAILEDFPDQAHVDRLREALWAGREYGRAAVMIGAGFSRTARPVRESAPALPLWPDLARALAEGLESGLSTRKGRPPNAEAPNEDPLRLAERYEAAFGRGALDHLLLTQVPDNDYQPGRLHSLLLRLPWSDVFTTNWDTLLERAAGSVVDRRYAVVHTVQDIPGAMKPRIVKLHGSLPSTRPFILTEEDYRTYPRRFAPFVNLLQQAIMENVFCLIGFSGNDPNFLYWTGWVRDHLGESAPQIYHCGLLQLSGPERALLQRRNVVPIDLSCLVPVDRFPVPEARQAKALEWLLLALEAGEPPDLRHWPEKVRPPRTPPSEGVPDVPEPDRPEFVEEPRWPKT